MSTPSLQVLIRSLVALSNSKTSLDFFLDDITSDIKFVFNISQMNDCEKLSFRCKCLDLFYAHNIEMIMLKDKIFISRRFND